MTAIERAEFKGRMRAVIFYVLAAGLLLALVAGFGHDDGPLTGLWSALAAASLVNLLPLGPLLKPNSRVARLLDDETTAGHRAMAATAGFWAATLSALALAMVVADGPVVASADVAHAVLTAGVVAALVSFATLELRAARG